MQTNSTLCRHLKERLNKDHKDKIYPELLRSMDDSSDQVRTATVECISAFLQCLEKEGDIACFKSLFSGLAVHMDDAEESMQRSVCKCFIKAASFDSQIVKEIMLENVEKHRTPHYCTEVLNYINDTS